MTWGTQAVAWVQSFSSPALDKTFPLLSRLGSPQLLFLLAAGAFWCVDKRLGLSLALVFLLSGYINQSLKELLAVPRPAGPGILPLGEWEGYALPSGHAQTATSVWGYWGVWLRRRWAWGVVAIAVGLVAFSRVYLAAHYPSDVVVGVVVGALVVILYLRGWAWLASRLESWPMSGQVALAAGATLLLALGAPGEQALAASGVLLGISTGWILEERYLRMEVSGSWWQYGGRLLVGGAGLGVLQGLEALLTGIPGMDLLTATALGGWVTLGAPAIFLLVRLTRRRELSATHRSVARSVPVR